MSARSQPDGKYTDYALICCETCSIYCEDFEIKVQQNGIACCLCDSCYEAKYGKITKRISKVPTEYQAKYFSTDPMCTVPASRHLSAIAYFEWKLDGFAPRKTTR